MLNNIANGLPCNSAPLLDNKFTVIAKIPNDIIASTTDNDMCFVFTFIVYRYKKRQIHLYLPL